MNMYGGYRPQKEKQRRKGNEEIGGEKNKNRNRKIENSNDDGGINGDIERKLERNGWRENGGGIKTMMGEILMLERRERRRE